MSETRKIAAILVADVVGYSFGRARRGSNLARLRALRSDLIDPTIAVRPSEIALARRKGDGLDLRVDILAVGEAQLFP